MLKKIVPISLCLIFIDQIIKLIVVKNVDLNSYHEVIPSIFNLTYVKNFGAAWSILSGNRIFLIMVALISIYLIYYYLIKVPCLKTRYIIIYSILIAGIFGNLIDRIIFGYVIDYLSLIIFNYNFPIFNFADMCITLPVTVLIILTLKGDKCEKDYN